MQFFRLLFGIEAPKPMEAPKRFIALDGLLSLLPPELMANIMAMVHFDHVRNISSINLACKVKMGISVTVIHGRFTLKELLSHKRDFPYLREIFGVIGCEEMAEVFQVFSLDLSTFTVQLPLVKFHRDYDHMTDYYGSHNTEDDLLLMADQLCDKMANLSAMKSVTVNVTEDTLLLSDPPQPSKRIRKLISWNEGIVDFCTIGRDKVLERFPCHAVVMSSWPSVKHHKDILERYPITMAILVYDSMNLSVRASAVLKYSTTIRSILCEYGHRGLLKEEITVSRMCRAMFSPDAYDGTYPLVHTFHVPVIPENIPDLMRIFPNLRNATVVPLSAYRVDGTPRYRDDSKAREEIAPFQARYPGVSFAFF